MDEAEIYASSICSRLNNQVFRYVETSWSMDYDPSEHHWEEPKEATTRQHRIEALEIHAFRYFELKMPTADAEEGIVCDAAYLRYLVYHSGLLSFDLEDVRCVILFPGSVYGFLTTIGE